jgi:hypothetical protein
LRRGAASPFFTAANMSHADELVIRPKRAAYHSGVRWSAVTAM